MAKSKARAIIKWSAITFFAFFIIALIGGALIERSTTESTAAAKTSAAKAPDMQTQNSSGITKDKFDTLEIGMTYDQVVAIIGSDGMLVSERTETNENGNQMHLKTYSWFGEDTTDEDIDNSTIPAASCVFLNGTLMSRHTKHLD